MTLTDLTLVTLQTKTNSTDTHITLTKVVISEEQLENNNGVFFVTVCMNTNPFRTRT